MKPMSKETGERREADRRVEPPIERRADVARSIAGDRREVENRGIGAAMVDALEDILKYERTSERLVRAAPKTDLPN
jgi:hypothetical protein